MKTMTVERGISVSAPIERAWQAVTDPDQLQQWYATGCPWEIPLLSPGGAAFFSLTPNSLNTKTDVFKAVIIAVDPPHLFTLKWEPDKQHHETTLVTSFALEEEADGTRVTIRESGFENYPDTVRQGRFDSTSSAYRLSVENLKAYLEGRPIPY